MLSTKLLRQSQVLSIIVRQSFQHRLQSSKVVAEKVTAGFVQDLQKIVSQKDVSTADAVRDQHGHDESFHKTSMPDVVVFANSVEEVSKVAQLCNKHKVPLIPFGSGTGLEGGINAIKGGVCLDLSHMKNVVQVNAEDFDCTVECGVTRGELNSFIRDTGLQFPVDPGADASLCGMCSTSASGTNAVRYGTMRENVLNLEVVLADGTVIWTAGKGTRCRKTSAGYNLTNLFVGSEGTLGVITKATIRLYGIPEATLAAVVHFPTIQEAVDTTVQVLQSGVPMARIEFLDDLAIDAFNKFSHYDMTVAPSLFLEFHGTPSSVQEQVAVVEEIAKTNNGKEFRWAKEPDERSRLWKARHEAVYACTALIPGSKPYTTDVCVPISKLPEIILKTKEMIKQNNLIGPMIGHVGDGNFHIFYPIDEKHPEQLKKVEEVSKKMAFLAMELNGTCTGEHGIGIGKLSLLEKEVGTGTLATMLKIKRALDPNGIMNPGKVFL